MLFIIVSVTDVLCVCDRSRRRSSPKKRKKRRITQRLTCLVSVMRSTLTSSCLTRLWSRNTLLRWSSSQWMKGLKRPLKWWIGWCALSFKDWNSYFYASFRIFWILNFVFVTLYSVVLDRNFYFIFLRANSFVIEIYNLSYKCMSIIILVWNV